MDARGGMRAGRGMKEPLVHRKEQRGLLGGTTANVFSLAVSGEE